MTTRANGIRLDWLSTSERQAADSLFAEAFLEEGAVTAAKDRALLALGIKRAGDDSPLRAWIRAMCAKNGLEVRFPQTEIGSMVEFNAELSRWVFWLA